ncbi:Nif11-like leader peptide family RiPP precursor [uncultured Thiohalocapsa sp.]|uniref:Nif11-like leader peptide family RiPP precursor n=1 Tax=uncultured Thiohalocapsa sp. TaxID=768990 RepID=UPI0025E83BF1|nr:Nif11-like leader peptide family RiPP precursor [uncultured Thiohalocapsa sp.]
MKDNQFIAFLDRTTCDPALRDALRAGGEDQDVFGVAAQFGYRFTQADIDEAMCHAQTLADDQSAGPGVSLLKGYVDRDLSDKALESVSGGSVSVLISLGIVGILGLVEGLDGKVTPHASQGYHRYKP